MSTYEGEGHGVSEDGHAIGHSPVPHVRQMYISSSSTRSSEAGHSHRLRSPIVPLVRSPGLRLYLSSSFARSVDTRIRNSPTVRASPVNAHTSVDTRIRNSPTVRASPVNAHTSVDTRIRNSSTVRASPVNAHTSVDTRIRNSPTVQASPVNAHTSVDTRIRNSPTVRASPVNAHTSADIATVRRSSNVITHTPADASGLPSKSRKRKLTSDIWDDFTAIYGDDGRLMQGQCIHCDTIFQTDKKFGTSHCRRHRLVCIEKAKMDELIGSMQPGDPRVPVLKRFKFDKERACYELIRMIVLHELPFRIVEYAGFRRFVASLNPAFKLMSRTTIKEDCMAEFDRQKLELLHLLKNLPSRVSLTADLWTSNQGQGYICATCHFVDNKWKLHKRIIKFASVETPHDASNLLNVMLKTMQDWGIEDKICTITLDNAAVNDLMVSYIKSNLSRRKLLAGNGDIFHQRCAAHVLNLVVQEGFKVSCPTVVAVRESVKYVGSSTQRKESFEKIVEQLGITCQRKVSLDVCTRWNSTYLMMKTASEYITAFDQLSVQDSSFNYAPSASQWKIAEEICKLLVVFYDATLVVSGSLYPTSNEYFKVLWKIKWVLAKEASSENATIRSMVVEMKKKFLKYWKLSYVTICIPIILDPRSKLKFLEYNLKNDTIVDGPKCLLIVKRKFKDMFNAYSAPQNSDSNISNEQRSQEASMDDPWASWSQHVARSTPQSHVWQEMYLLFPHPRVISDYRSRLNSETVDALICLQDWMRPSGVIDATSIEEDLNNDDEMLCASPYFRVERNETQVDP